MNKTKDIEDAIALTIGPGKVTLAELEERLYDGYPQLRLEQRTWIGIAVSNLLRDGRIKAVGWSPKRDSYEGHRVVEAVPS